MTSLSNVITNIDHFGLYEKCFQHYLTCIHLLAVSWSLLWNPAALLHTILTKHQAFAPSGPISFRPNFRFIKVEFFLRDSAKAWQEKSGPRVQLFWSNSGSSPSSLPSREFVRLFNQRMRDNIESRIKRHKLPALDLYVSFLESPHPLLISSDLVLQVTWKTW